MSSGPRAPHRLADTAGGRGVVVLDQDAVEQGVPVVEAAPGAHCGLLQRPQARRGLAGVEQPGPGPGECLDVPAGERRDAAQPLQEVQRRPLAGEDSAQRAANAQHALARTGFLPLTLESFQLGGGRERAEDARGGGHARDDQGLLGHDESRAARAGGNASLGGTVAGAHVLLEREREELSDCIVGPAEVDGRPARRPVPRGGARHSYFLPLRDAGRRLPPLFARAPFPAFPFRDPALRALFFALRAALALPRPLAPPLAFFGFARRAAGRLGARARAPSSDSLPIPGKTSAGSFSISPRAIDFTRSTARSAIFSTSRASSGIPEVSRPPPVPSPPGAGGCDRGGGGCDLGCGGCDLGCGGCDLGCGGCDFCCGGCDLGCPPGVPDEEPCSPEEPSPFGCCGFLSSIGPSTLVTRARWRASFSRFPASSSARERSFSTTSRGARATNPALSRRLRSPCNSASVRAISFSTRALSAAKSIRPASGRCTSTSGST